MHEEIKMARKPKKVTDDELVNDVLEHDEDTMTIELEEEDDVEETQELTFGDESYRRLGEIEEPDDWN
jgi:hypothetical protein